MKNNNKKNEIIEVAYNLFINKGYENTSVDEIILNVGIAKGTFYYYFETKEALLEEVINVILNQEEKKALEVLNLNISIEEKIVGIIYAMRPEVNEESIANVLNKQENIIMHKKINEKIINIATPILSKVIDEEIKSNIFNCTNVEERIRLLLIISREMFDNNNFSINSIEVFIDTVEKILGAKEGSMSFIMNLIK